MTEIRADAGLRGIVRLRDAAAPESAREAIRDAGERSDLAITIRATDEAESPYQGIVPLEGVHLADCLNRYFAQSVQLPTRVHLATGAENNAANSSGLLIQRLPGRGQHQALVSDRPSDRPSDRASASDLRNAAWERIVALTETLSDAELAATDNVTLLRRLFGGEELRLYPPTKQRFYCGCSKQGTVQALNIMGVAEVSRIAQEDGIVVVTCEFCRAAFEFTPAEIASIFSEPDAGTTNH